MVLRDLPDPRPKPGEIAIDVVCAGVNPVDWKVRDGALKKYFTLPFPIVLGYDVAGRVAELGEGVTAFEIGDPVFACCIASDVARGTFATKVAIEAIHAAQMPQTLTFAQAAGIPLAALTAWQALHDTAGLRKNQTVLIHAAAGGVGSLAVPMAKAAGARVFGTASAANTDYVRGLGADAVIDYRSEDVAAAVGRLAPEGVDVVLDGAGGGLLAQSFGLVKRGGMLTSIVAEPDATLGARHGINVAWVSVAPNGAELKAIAGLIDQGALRVPATEELPLDRAAAALERSKAKHVRGKLVLRVSAG